MVFACAYGYVCPNQLKVLLPCVIFGVRVVGPDLLLGSRIWFLVECHRCDRYFILTVMMRWKLDSSFEQGVAGTPHTYSTVNFGLERDVCRCVNGLRVVLASGLCTAGIAGLFSSGKRLSFWWKVWMNSCWYGISIVSSWIDRFKQCHCFCRCAVFVYVM
jgi:hypothetical protein